MIKKLTGVKISYAPYYNVSSISSGQINMKSGKTVNTINIVDGQLTEEINETKAGDQVKQEFTFTFTGDLSDINLLNSGPLIISIELTDNTYFALGSITIPARKDTIQRNTNEVTAKFYRFTDIAELN